MKLGTGLLTIALGALLATGAILAETDRRLDSAREDFIDHAADEAMVDVKPVADALNHIYENLRTLSALPSVRGIDRHADNLDADARETIQQVYNNLANAVAVSEVYVLPADFNPDRTDPATGAEEEPILMFDELIVDAADRIAPELRETLSPQAQEEIESYEYREFVKQIAWLRERYPTRNTIEGLSFPIIGSSSLITCDNTYFIHSGLDADRKGVLFSLPFYRHDGSFGGVVSAIILDRALQASLPETHMALLNETYGYHTGLTRDEIRAGEFAYADTMPLNFNDTRGRWSVWIGRTESDYLSSAQTAAALSFRFNALALIAGISLMIAWAWRNWHHNLESARLQKLELETRVVERTAEIHRLAREDALTGLNNRGHMAEVLDTLCKNEEKTVSGGAIVGHGSGGTGLLRAA